MGHLTPSKLILKLNQGPTRPILFQQACLQQQPIPPAYQAHGVVQGYQDQGVPQAGAPPTQVRGQATGVLPAEVLEARRRQTHSPYGNPHIYPDYGGEQPNPHLPRQAQFFAGSARNQFAFGSAMNAERPAHVAVPVDDDRGSSLRGINQNDYAFNERQR